MAAITLHRQRQGAHGGRRAVDAAALRPAQRPRPAGPALRLRPRPVRRLHRAHQGRGGALVHPAGVARAANVEITTLEGLAQNGKLHPLQQAWIDEQVPACGFCQNGQILTAKALLDKTPNPTDAQIREGMADTLCRCMTYYRIQAAIKRAAQRMADGMTSRHRRAANSSSTSGMLVASVRRRVGRRRRRRCCNAGAGRRAVSRSRFPSARLVDRDPPGQHRDVLRRQDRSRPGHRHGVPPDHVGRARHRLRHDERA